MKTPIAIVLGALVIAASILFIGRYEIAAAGYGFSGGESSSDAENEDVFRIDRWTGTIERCSQNQSGKGIDDTIKEYRDRNAQIVYCGWGFPGK